MFDDFETYFVENIILPYGEYLKYKRSIKAGNSLLLRATTDYCQKLYHLREHVPEFSTFDLNYLFSICPDYKLVKDVSNVIKHKKITKYVPQISSAEKIFEITINTIYEDNQGEFNHIENAVFAELKDGIEKDLHIVIINVLNMWITELTKRNLIRSGYKKRRISNQMPKRTKNSGRHNIVVTKGIRINKKMKFQRYNYERKIIEPVDLSGASVNLRIYKQLYDVTLSLKNHENGDKKEFTIKVDEKTKRFFDKETVDQEIIDKFMKIAKEQGVI
ncbi:MAG: hypothetical protein H6571_18715 [Lewinellaceae bacterium]|nr:hypothetical protein [Lewinellaceae bacterium]